MPNYTAPNEFATDANTGLHVIHQGEAREYQCWILLWQECKQRGSIFLPIADALDMLQATLRLHPVYLRAILKAADGAFWRLDHKHGRLYPVGREALALRYARIASDQQHPRLLRNLPGGNCPRIIAPFAANLTTFKAILRGAWHYAHNHPTISRDREASLWNVTKTTLRRWDTLAGLTVRPQYDETADPNLELPPWHMAPRPMQTADGVQEVCKYRIPNQYLTHGYREARSRSINRRIRSRVNTATAHVRDLVPLSPERTYYDTWSDYLKVYKRHGAPATPAKVFNRRSRSGVQYFTRTDDSGPRVIGPVRGGYPHIQEGIQGNKKNVTPLCAKHRAPTHTHVSSAAPAPLKAPGASGIQPQAVPGRQPQTLADIDPTDRIQAAHEVIRDQETRCKIKPGRAQRWLTLLTIDHRKRGDYTRALAVASAILDYARWCPGESLPVCLDDMPAALQRRPQEGQPRAGEMLAAIERKPGIDTSSMQDEVVYTHIINDNGISHSAAHNGQQIASAPPRRTSYDYELESVGRSAS